MITGNYRAAFASRLIFFGLWLLLVPQVFSEEITAGVARAAFDLPKGVPLAGYSRRHGEASEGAHDPVGVRALVVRGSEAAAAFVSSDLLVIDENLFREIDKRVNAAQTAPITLFIAATHTHSGPGAYGKKFLEKISMGHYDARVFEAIVTAIADAIQKADQARQSVEFGCGATTTEGLIKNRVQEGGFADNQLTVCAVQSSAQANPLAVIVNFSAHPTTLGAWQRSLSADYPGVIAKAIEAQLPGTTVLFFAGAVGDQAPVKSGDGYQRAEFIGKPLASEALKLLPEIKRGIPEVLLVSQETLRLPKAKVRLSRRLALPGFIGQAMVDDDAQFSVAVFGKTAWLSVPCDLSSALGKQLKEAAANKGLAPVIMGFTNDYIGYCVTEPVYGTGKYEALMAFNGPFAGRLVTDKLIESMNRLAEKK